jgi:hypothetical protein
MRVRVPKKFEASFRLFHQSYYSEYSCDFSKLEIAQAAVITPFEVASSKSDGFLETLTRY